MESVFFQLPHIRLAALSNISQHNIEHTKSEQLDKPKILALHGWLDNAGSFEMMLPYLNDYHVVALDFPGHGLSDPRGPDAHYHFVDWVYDVYMVIEMLGWQKFDIVGHSMGAMVGGVFAGTFPERVNKLFAIDSLGLITTEASQARDQLRQAIVARRRLSRRSPKGSYPNLDHAIHARTIVGGLNRHEAEVLAKRGLKQQQGGYIWRSDSRLRTASAVRFTEQQASSFLVGIECPVMMMAGKDSGEAVPKLRQQFEKYYKNLTCVEIDGGHHCHMRYPEKTCQLLLQFLAD